MNNFSKRRYMGELFVTIQLETINVVFLNNLLKKPISHAQTDTHSSGRTLSFTEDGLTLNG